MYIAYEKDLVEEERETNGLVGPGKITPLLTTVWVSRIAVEMERGALGS